MTPVRPLLAIAALLVAGTGISFLDAACELEVDASYSGPYPSPAAQEALHAISGRTLIPGTLGPPGMPLQVRNFTVAPNPATGMGPVVVLRDPKLPPSQGNPNAPQGTDGRWFVPVLTDGDAADLVLRATGEAPVNFGGPMSSIYRATLGLDER